MNISSFFLLALWCVLFRAEEDHRMWLTGWPLAHKFQNTSCPNHMNPDFETVRPHLGLDAAKFDPLCFKSQSTEDALAYKHFFRHFNTSSISRHYFIEMGGLDGITFSNTYFFEHTFGWRGIMIEPDPDRYRELLTNRPNVIAFNNVVCSKPSITFIRGGAVGGALELFDLNFYRRWYRGNEAKITIPCKRMTDILQMVDRRSGVTCYDFFSLDVEGAELEVMQTLDLERYRFKVLVIEEDGNNVAREEEVASLLRQNGYVRFPMIEDRRNGWYVARRHPSGCQLG